MHCRDFMDCHLAFVDGSLSRADMRAMRRHLAECGACAHRDTAMRRGLLVLRNLPTVQPSPDFAVRLYARIRQLQSRDSRAASYRGPGLGAFASAAAAVVTIGYFAASMLNWTEIRSDLALEPVVAMEPAFTPSPIASYDFVASAATGMPIWPAAVFAEQAPIHFVNAELQFEEIQR